jgi:hypothetical protein
MEQNPSWEASRFSVSQEIPRILWNPKVRYRIHKCPHKYKNKQGTNVLAGTPSSYSKGAGSNLYAITGYSTFRRLICSSRQITSLCVPKIRHCMHSGLSPNIDTYPPSIPDDRACISTRSPPHIAQW